MNFAEIQTAVQGNPALLTEIANGLGKDILPIVVGSANDDILKGIIPSLGQKGFVVRTKAEDDSYLSSYIQRQDIKDGIVGPAIKEVHDLYDRDFEQLFGEKKAPNEKTYNAYKRKIEELKTSKIDDPILKQQLVTLQGQIQEKDTKYQKEISDLKSEYFTREIESFVSADLNSVSIAIPAHLKTDDEKQRYVASQRSMMKRDMLGNLIPKKDNDGNIVFYEGDKPLISTTDGKPLKPIDIINDRYSFYIDKSGNRNQGGAGSGGDGSTPATFTDKEQVFKYLENKGLKPLTKEFTYEYAKLIKEHKLTK